MENFGLKQKLLIAVGAVVFVYFVLMLVCVVPGLKTCSEGDDASTLTVWGVFDTSAIWEDLFDGFEPTHGVKLEYRRIPFDDYERDLINAFANQGGPDIFMVHNSWLPAYQEKLAPMPQGNEWITFREFEETFPDAVVNDFTRNRAQIYAVPLYLDTLALYYNRDLLNSVGIVRPPETWEDFQDAIERLTIVDANGNLVRAGAAIGTSRNINRSTDIFSLLMLQTFGDVEPIDPDLPRARLTYSTSQGAAVFSPGTEALRFYTDFANPVLKSYTWNRDQHYSIDAFIDQDVAMMFNYSHHIETIRSRVPELNFGVAKVPQPEALIEQQRRVDYPSYFGLGVSRFASEAKRQKAWEFLLYMTESRQQWQYRLLTGRPPARRDLVETLLEDPDYSVFAQQALTARSWYQPNATSIETYFADMIESVIDGTSLREALQRAEGQINVLIRRDE